MKAKTEVKQRGVFEKCPGSGVWWVRFADRAGRIRREKAGSKSAATQLYMRRKNQVREQTKLPENLRVVVRISDIAPAIEKDYKANGQKSYDWVERRLRKHILPFFGTMAASELGTDDLNRYVDKRQDEGASNASIN